MVICKAGSYHRKNGTNCQDYGIEVSSPLRKVVMDGCSASPHSETAVYLIAALMEQHRVSPFTAMDVIYTMILKSTDAILDYGLVSVVDMIEGDEGWHVTVCGDGYVILQDHDGNFHYHRIDHGPAPPFYAYNFIDPSLLRSYKEGVQLEEMDFSRSEYTAVGIATDGLRYLLEVPPLKEEFERLLLQRKVGAIQRLFNLNCDVLKDDITIAF